LKFKFWLTSEAVPWTSAARRKRQCGQKNSKSLLTHIMREASGNLRHYTGKDYRIQNSTVMSVHAQHVVPLLPATSSTRDLPEYIAGDPSTGSGQAPA